ncbi:MAG: signal peptidase I [Clostridia bacterium]|nr:signal peptidase I [Clostridia bacterium]
MRKTISIILKTVTTVLVAIAVIIAIMLVGMRIFGFHVYTVLSGSMEPTYHVGSLIYVKEVDVDELKKDDVITFMLSDQTTATHRIVEVVPDENDPDVIRFRTKGDANSVEDQSLVHYENVIGKPVFTIPYMGYVANYIQQPPGIYVAIAVAAALVMLVFCADGLSEKKEEPAPAAETATGNAPDLEANDAKAMPEEGSADTASQGSSVEESASQEDQSAE